MQLLILCATLLAQTTAPAQNPLAKRIVGAWDGTMAVDPKPLSPRVKAHLVFDPAGSFVMTFHKEVMSGHYEVKGESVLLKDPTPEAHHIILKNFRWSQDRLKVELHSAKGLPDVFVLRLRRVKATSLPTTTQPARPDR